MDALIGILFVLAILGVVVYKNWGKIKPLIDKAKE